jgi:uncharacterized protein
MQFNQQMLAFVMDLLKEKLPKEYYYHNYLHAEYILDKAVEIGMHENCTPEELEVLKVAALWHDVGYMNAYEGHEVEGCRLVKKYFPQFGYSEGDMQKVCDMIMSTKIPQSPHNKLEQILADADLEYLGTADAEMMADQFYLELKSRNPALTKEEWNNIQISFIQKHHYFTQYCITTREPMKQAYMKRLLGKAS